MVINSGNPKENSQGPIDIKIDFIEIGSKLGIFHLLEGKKSIINYSKIKPDHVTKAYIIQLLVFPI